jgi:NADPH:quinone reductase-like Zn-dependent oxidoreductase
MIQSACLRGSAIPRAARAYAEYVAWQALVDTAKVAAGQRVLIHGAGVTGKIALTV